MGTVFFCLIFFFVERKKKPKRFLFLDLDFYDICSDDFRVLSGRRTLLACNVFISWLSINLKLIVIYFESKCIHTELPELHSTKREKGSRQKKMCGVSINFPYFQFPYVSIIIQPFDKRLSGILCVHISFFSFLWACLRVKFTFNWNQYEAMLGGAWRFTCFNESFPSIVVCFNCECRWFSWPLFVGHTNLECGKRQADQHREEKNAQNLMWIIYSRDFNGMKHLYLICESFYYSSHLKMRNCWKCMNPLAHSTYHFGRVVFLWAYAHMKPKTLSKHCYYRFIFEHQAIKQSKSFQIIPSVGCQLSNAWASNTWASSFGGRNEQLHNRNNVKKYEAKKQQQWHPSQEHVFWVIETWTTIGILSR